jgi:hypothetical protein
MANANIKRMGLAATLTVLAVAAVPRSASAQDVWGTWDRPLEGQRFETMRALAHYLDEATQDALAGVVQARRRGTPADRRYIASIRDFARRVESFHNRMDEYDVSPFEVPDEVDYLVARARRMSQLVRQVGAYQSSYDDWNNVADVLNRMRRLLNGENVEVPPAHDEYGDYDRDYGNLRRGGGTVSSGGIYGGTRGGTYGGTYSGGPLVGSRLQQFRDLAHQLDVSANRTLQIAERSASNNDRAGGVLADLRHFVEQTRDVHGRSDANQLSPREIGPIVDHLLEDARLADRSMRDARLFSDAWDEWARAIDTLNRMAGLMR